VTFPDDTTYPAHLYADTQTIVWITGTVWTKVVAEPVPYLRGLTVGQARTTLNAAGFSLGSQTPGRNCDVDGRIFSQSPAGERRRAWDLRSTCGSGRTEATRRGSRLPVPHGLAVRYGASAPA